MVPKRSKELEDLKTQLTKANEREEKLKNELSEALKKSADYQKKCAGFFNQVVSLNSKQQESEEQIAMYKRTLDNLRAQIAEKDAMHQLMSDAVSLFWIIEYCMVAKLLRFQLDCKNNIYILMIFSLSRSKQMKMISVVNVRRRKPLENVWKMHNKKANVFDGRISRTRLQYVILKVK